MFVHWIDVDDVKPAIKKDKESDLLKSPRDRKECSLCHAYVSMERMDSHAGKHVENRPLFACTYCDYKAATTVSIKVHIGWRHTGCKHRLAYYFLCAS